MLISCLDGLYRMASCSGTKCVQCGVWCMGYGAWGMAWCVQCGVWCMGCGVVCANVCDLCVCVYDCLYTYCVCGVDEIIIFTV